MSSLTVRNEYETLTEPHQEGFIIKEIKRNTHGKYETGYVSFSYKLIGKKVKIELVENGKI